MTTDCENLLKRFLVLNPLKRGTLTQIMTDKWVNQGFEAMEENDCIERLQAKAMEAANLTVTSTEGKLTMRHYKEPPEDADDPARLAKLYDLGWTAEDIKKSLKEHAYDEIHATYVLLGLSVKKKSSTDGPNSMQKATSINAIHSSSKTGGSGNHADSNGTRLSVKPNTTIAHAPTTTGYDSTRVKRSNSHVPKNQSQTGSRGSRDPQALTTNRPQSSRKYLPEKSDFESFNGRQFQSG